jgi:hypothetical protein
VNVKQQSFIDDNNDPNKHKYRLIVVSYGGGVNSTAMLIAMRKLDIIPHAIVFADTGGEMPHTYRYLVTFGAWLASNGMPPITAVKYDSQHGTLETECLNNETIPSKAFGNSGCSVKWKRQPIDKWIKDDRRCAATLARGEKVVRFIGIHYGEKRRGRIPDTEQFEFVYPLRGLQIGQQGCEQLIANEGLPLPGKSACFFCPAMKVHEIKSLAANHPDLAKRAIEMERNAREAGNLSSVKGLGGFGFSWESVLRGER